MNIDSQNNPENRDSQRLRIALQKSGRLHQESMNLLQLCGINLTPSSRQLFCRHASMPLDLLLIRDDDIPNFVAEGICDLGIVGENILCEERLASEQRDFRVQVQRKLGFAHCRLSLAAPPVFAQLYNEQGAAALAGRRIATSYPSSLQDFLQRSQVAAEIVKISGSVELAPKLKIADLICDLISTSSTLVANNLLECQTLLHSEAVLIAHSGQRTHWRAEKTSCLEQLLLRLHSVLRARNSKYVMLNAPKDKIEVICGLLPGADSPTVIPLSDPKQVAIHAVSSEPVLWETMEALKSAGAHSILIQPIEKMLP